MDGVEDDDTTYQPPPSSGRHQQPSASTQQAAPVRMRDYESASDHSSEAGQVRENDGSVCSLEISRLPQTQVNRRARPTEVTLLFLSAAGSTMGWTALLSMLVYYTETLGMNSFLVLNLCVFLPLLPMAILQAIYDHEFDRQYQSWVSFSFRGHVGFFLTIAVVLLLPWGSSNLISLSLLALILGTASSILQGSLKQLASIVYHSCGRLPAAVTSGMQASAVFVLIVSLSCDGNDITSFYCGVAVLVTGCWMAFLVIMSKSHDIVDSMGRRDESMRLLLGASLLADEVGEWRETFNEISYRDLWIRTWPCCVSVMITVASSMSVASWFNRVHSADPTNESLPQVLFYARLFCDLLSRPATLLLERPLSPLEVAILSILRLGFVPLFFLYESEGSLLPRNDTLLIFAVGVFAFSSGYIVTVCYQIAPLLLADHEKHSTSRQNGLLNVCFSASVMTGLLASFALLWSGLAR